MAQDDSLTLIVTKLILQTFLWRMTSNVWELSATAEAGKCPGHIMDVTLVSEANVATRQGLETDVLSIGSK